MDNMYTFDSEGNSVPCSDIVEWGEFMHRCKSICVTNVGDVMVSTVFLGLDHGFGGGTPILWETMVFDGSRVGVTKYDHEQKRYTSMKEALEGHKEIAAEIISEQAVN